MTTQTLDRQLKETLRKTQACWAAWVTRSAAWELRAAYRLTKRGQSALLAFLAEDDIHAWLSGALTGGRSRARALNARANLDCAKLFAFPRRDTSEVLLVGVDRLNAESQHAWRTFVDNSRLREEIEARARNLGLIHKVVQQVIGQTDLETMAQSAAELMAKSFVYELAIVMLADESGELTIRGLGGAAAPQARPGFARFDDQRQPSIIRNVFSTGKRILANDVTREKLYASITGWEAGSELCVPMTVGERVVGIIDVESRHMNAFTQNDLLVVESLAGILASVVVNAAQYQQLQNTVVELQETQQELQARIGAQRDAEERLVQAAKLAAVGEMAAGVAHELNNPLTTVVGFTELVMDELPGDSPQRADLDLVLREARRASMVVRRLLDFSRQSESVRVRTDFNEIVSDILALMRHLLISNNITLNLDLQRDLPWVSVDRNQLKQVLLNLLHNALNAMPKSGGTISITTQLVRRHDHRWLTVAIEDTGAGIQREHLQRIFEPFFTTRSGQGGTGLGLSVTYGIVTEHGGMIEVESQPGVGSTFTVWLPVEA